MWLQLISCAKLVKFLICNIAHFVINEMAVLSKIKPYSDAVDYFKEIPFDNNPIKKSKVKRLKIINRLAELPFYEQLSIIKTNQPFRGYAMP